MQMSSIQRFRYAGWSAYLSGAAMVLSLVALILFSSLGQAWGIVYEAAIFLQLLFMLPFVFVLQARFGSESSGLKRFSDGVAIFLVLFVTIAQALVIFGAFGPQNFSQTLDKGLTVSSAIGIWLVLPNYLGHGTWTVKRNLTSFGTLAAAGFILTPIVFKNVEPGGPLIIIGLLVSVIGYAVWTVLLGRLLLSGQLDK
jgi:hypothetical protein